MKVECSALRLKLQFSKTKRERGTSIQLRVIMHCYMIQSGKGKIRHSGSMPENLSNRYKIPALSLNGGACVSQKSKKNRTASNQYFLSYPPLPCRNRVKTLIILFFQLIRFRAIKVTYTTKIKDQFNSTVKWFSLYCIRTINNP